MPGSTFAQNLCSEGRKESSGGLTLPPGMLVLQAAIGLPVYLKLRRSADPQPDVSRTHSVPAALSQHTAW